MVDPFLTEKQILRKLGGDKISSKVFTYDGNEDAEFVDLYDLRAVVLSNSKFDLSKIKKIKCAFASTGQEVEFTEGDFTLIKFGDLDAVQVSLGNKSAPVVFADSIGGLLGYAQPGFGYCSYVEFAETIVPIDQKYLPGVCLPVVELSTTFSMGAYLTDAENELLTEAHAKNVPLVIRCNMNLDNIGVFENTALVWCPITSGNDQLFVASFGGLVLQIFDLNSAGKWACNAQ